jgi:hypothetical protein
MGGPKSPGGPRPVDYNVPLPRVVDMQGRLLDPQTGRPLPEGQEGVGSIFHAPSATPVPPTFSRRPIAHDRSEQGSSTLVKVSHSDLLQQARRQGFQGQNVIMHIIPYPKDEERSSDSAAPQSGRSPKLPQDLTSSDLESSGCHCCGTILAGLERDEGFTLLKLHEAASRGCEACDVLQQSVRHFSKFLFSRYKDEKVRINQGGNQHSRQLAQAKRVSVHFDEYGGETMELSFYGSGK